MGSPRAEVLGLSGGVGAPARPREGRMGRRGARLQLQSAETGSGLDQTGLEHLLALVIL